MQTRDETDLFDDALAAMPIDPAGILAFRLPRPPQRRLSKLVAQVRTGKLTDGEQRELQRYVALETMVRALKAKALAAGAGNPL